MESPYAESVYYYTSGCDSYLRCIHTVRGDSESGRCHHTWVQSDRKYNYSIPSAQMREFGGQGACNVQSNLSAFDNQLGYPVEEDANGKYLATKGRGEVQDAIYHETEMSYFFVIYY